MFKDITSTDKDKAIHDLIEHSSPRKDFFLMTGLAVGMASFGILMDSTVIVIGSMLVAPILYPVLSVALGIVLADRKLIMRSLMVLGKSALLSIVLAFIIAAFFMRDGASTDVLLQTIAKRQLLFLSVLVAGVAGFAATFSTIKPKLNQAMPGVAISVALIPPLAAVGVGLARIDWSVTSGALILFLINVAGIVCTSVIAFSLGNFYVKRVIAKKAVAEEDREIKKEEKEK